MTRTALITGFTGQDGVFLARLLLDQGYRVVGVTRHIGDDPPPRARPRFDFSPELASGQLVLAEADLQSRASLDRTIERHEPEEIYNLAAQSFVSASFNQPELTIETNFTGVVNLIESLCAGGNGWRMYQASSSEMFGNPEPARAARGMDEQTPLGPTSPYAIAKAAAHFYCRMKREQGYFISSGILFNHESEIRGGSFVSQKIVRGVVAAMQGRDEVLELGNLNARRDWGYAGDYVRAMWLMLQRPAPGEFCVGTGVARSVRQFVESAIRYFDRKIEWRGDGVAEEGLVDDRVIVRVNPDFFRPNDLTHTAANPRKARDELGWEPEISFDRMVSLMIEGELDRRRALPHE